MKNFVTLMKEAPGSSETSVLTRATRRNNPEDTILPWVSVHKRTIPTDDRRDRRSVPTFEGRGCCLVNTTDPYGR
jgi:hypothetical protein